MLELKRIIDDSKCSTSFSVMKNDKVLVLSDDDLIYAQVLNICGQTERVPKKILETTSFSTTEVQRFIRESVKWMRTSPNKETEKLISKLEAVLKQSPGKSPADLSRLSLQIFDDTEKQSHRLSLRSPVAKWISQLRPKNWSTSSRRSTTMSEIPSPGSNLGTTSLSELSMGSLDNSSRNNSFCLDDSFTALTDINNNHEDFDDGHNYFMGRRNLETFVTMRRSTPLKSPRPRPNRSPPKAFPRQASLVAKPTQAQFGTLAGRLISALREKSTSTADSHSSPLFVRDMAYPSTNAGSGDAASLSLHGFDDPSVLDPSVASNTRSQGDQRGRLSWEQAAHYVSIVMETLGAMEDATCLDDQRNGPQNLCCDSCRSTFRSVGGLLSNTTRQPVISSQSTATLRASSPVIQLTNGHSTPTNSDDTGSCTSQQVEVPALNQMVVHVPRTESDDVDESHLAELAQELSYAIVDKERAWQTGDDSRQLTRICLAIGDGLVTCRPDICVGVLTRNSCKLIDDAALLFQMDTRPVVRDSVCQLLQAACALVTASDLHAYVKPTESASLANTVVMILLDSVIPAEIFAVLARSLEHCAAGTGKHAISMPQIQLLLRIFSPGLPVPVHHRDSFLLQTPSLCLDLIDLFDQREDESSSFADATFLLFLAISLQFKASSRVGSNDFEGGEESGVEPLVDAMRSRVSAPQFTDRVIICFNEEVNPLPREYLVGANNGDHAANPIDHIMSVICRSPICSNALFSRNDRLVITDVFIRRINTCVDSVQSSGLADSLHALLRNTRYGLTDEYSSEPDLYKFDQLVEVASDNNLPSLSEYLAQFM